MQVGVTRVKATVQDGAYAGRYCILNLGAHIYIVCWGNQLDYIFISI